jgi:hypothetical protein
MTSRFYKQDATQLFPTLYMRFSNETEVVGKQLAQFRVITVARQSFQFSPCMTPNLKQLHFLMKPQFEVL